MENSKAWGGYPMAKHMEYSQRKGIGNIKWYSIGDTLYSKAYGIFSSKAYGIHINN